ncbi:MAG: hypothetical protein ABEJ94_09245 [Halorientalis sp.]
MIDPPPLATNRLRPLVAAVLAVCLVAGAAIPAAGLLADAPTTGGAATDGSASGVTATDRGTARTGEPSGAERSANATVPAGARLAGAIGGQQTELAGELETRALVVRLDRADSPSERAAVLAELEARTDARLASLRERRERLRAAADNRSVPAGAYAHLAATVAVEATVNRRLAERGERATATLPAAVRAEYGISVERFRNLSDRSRSVLAALRRDLQALGTAGFVDEVIDAIDAGEGVDADELLDAANRTDWPVGGNATLDGVADGSDDPLGGALDGNVTDADGLIDGTNGTNGTLDGSGTPTSGEPTDDGILDGDALTATDADAELTADGTDDGLLGG